MHLALELAVVVASVTLPLNVSLDLGSRHGAQHDLATIDTDFS